MTSKVHDGMAGDSLEVESGGVIEIKNGGRINLEAGASITGPSIVDNTSNTEQATTAFSKNQDAVLRRNPVQSVNLTYAASASSGIAIADSDQIDYGINDFSIVFTGSLPDWTAGSILIQKLTSNVGYQLETVTTSGLLKLTINTTTYTSSDLPALVAGTMHQIVAAVAVGAVNTTVDFYVDGVHLGLQQTAANPGTVSNAAVLYLLGTSAIRTAGALSSYAGFNRALNAADVLDYYRNGVITADKWGNNTSIITGNDQTFAGASNWANGDINSYDETTGGHLTITASVAAQYCRLPVANATTVIGKKYRLTYTAATLVKTWTIKDYGGTQTIGTISAEGTVNIEFIAATAGGLKLIADDATSSVIIDDVKLVEIGATCSLQPESIQRDQWYDAANGLIATYPLGTTLTRPVIGKQGTITTETTGAVTLTIAKLLTGIIVGSPNAARAYTLDTPANINATGLFDIGDYIDWTIINLDTTAIDIITVTGVTSHTVVGVADVAANQAGTGALWCTSGRFRTVKTATATYVTYRIS